MQGIAFGGSTFGSVPLRRLPRAGGLHDRGFFFVLPLLCCPNERREDRARKFALLTGPLGMPLHADDKVIGRIELNCFDHSIDRRDRCDAQIVASGPNCLMMA